MVFLVSGRCLPLQVIQPLYIRHSELHGPLKCHSTSTNLRLFAWSEL